MDKKIVDIMLDLETMGVGVLPAVTEIAAVSFIRDTGEILDEFHECIDLQDCIDCGLKVSASTVSFWIEQDIDSRLSYLRSQRNAVSLHDALTNFSGWIESITEENDIMVWGNGILSDNVWIQSAYESSNFIRSPIEYWQHNDVRTIVDLGSFLGLPNHKVETDFDGVIHNPIDDCKHQIKYLCSYFKDIKEALNEA